MEVIIYLLVAIVAGVMVVALALNVVQHRQQDVSVKPLALIALIIAAILIARLAVVAAIVGALAPVVAVAVRLAEVVVAQVAVHEEVHLVHAVN